MVTTMTDKIAIDVVVRERGGELHLGFDGELRKLNTQTLGAVVEEARDEIPDLSMHRPGTKVGEIIITDGTITQMEWDHD